MDRDSKIQICYLTIAFAALVMSYALYTEMRYPFGGDQGLNVLTMRTIYTSFFIWQPNNYSGLINILGSIPSDIFNIIALPIYKASIIWGFILEMVVLSYIGLIGMFYLVYELTEKCRKRTRYVGAIAASILFSFHFISHLNTLSVPVVVFLPLVVLFTKRLFYDKHTAKNAAMPNLFGLILSVSFFIAMGGYGYFFLNLIILVLLAILTLLLSDRRNIFRNAKYMAAVAVLAVGINLSWIATTYTFINHIGHVFFKASLGTLTAVNINLLQSLLAFGPQLNNAGRYSTLIIVPILIISLLAYRHSRKNRGIVASLLILYLIMVVMATTISKPFGILFSKAINTVPYLLTLRYPYFSTHYVLLFVISALFGVGAANIMERADRERMQRIVLSALIIAIIAGYIYMLEYIPISSQEGGISIPNHVFQISNYINSKSGDFNVATIPVDPNLQVESWYVGVNVYSALIGKPVYTGGYTHYNEIFWPNTKAEYYSLATEIENNFITNTKISNLLGVFGIRYVIVQGGALENSPCEYCFVTQFNSARMYTNLNGSENLSFVGKYGNSSIYENNNYVPLVYATNIYSTGNSIDLISAMIGNSSFDIHNLSVYSTRSFGLFNSTGKADLIPIKEFSKISLSFSYDTPTHATVYVHNANTPFYLVFRETYDPYWIAYYQGGGEIPQAYHIAVNGFANAWYVNRTGSYAITLYYTQQTAAWIYWIVGFAALGVTLWIGYMGYSSKRRITGKAKRNPAHKV